MLVFLFTKEYLNMVNRTHKQGDRLHLYSTIKTTKGATRSVLIDLEREDFTLIPNDLIDFLEKYNGQLITYIYQELGDDVANEYLSFLHDRDVIFYNELTKEHFPPISEDWDAYSTITNTVIDVYHDDDLNSLYKVIQHLKDFNCQHIELRFFYTKKPNEIQKTLEIFNDSIIRSITLTLPFVDKIDQFEELFKKYARLMEVNLFEKNTDRSFTSTFPIFLIDSDNPCLACGQIDVKGFAINLEGYNESKKFNSCLNRKLSLNLHNGDIKNCSSMPESFGNLHTDNVSDIIKTSNFQRL